MDNIIIAYVEYYLFILYWGLVDRWPSGDYYVDYCDVIIIMYQQYVCESHARHVIACHDMSWHFVNVIINGIDDQ